MTLLTDFYELTMMQGYYEKGQNETVIFDVFFRQNPSNGGYSICAGLEQVIEYVKNLNFTYEDVDYLAQPGYVQRRFPPLPERVPLYRRYLRHPRGDGHLPQRRHP